jgi:PIN domain nuclease of toxin-antitoxin system
LRALLDTHTLLWAVLEPRSLSPRVRALVEDRANEFVLSAVTVWEVAVKASMGKLAVPGPVPEFFAEARRELGLLPLTVTDVHCLRVGELPWHHRDPFDRLLIAQSLVEGVPILTHDRRIRTYDLEVIW